ncbi:MAG: hypothetical protein JWM99_1020 [Verrucomicrobiales bacterium]|nr:hypothetical protein [Verrucomicrobiales bacterium]
MTYSMYLGEVVFRWILQTTWQAAVLVGLIMLAQRLLRRCLAPSWRYGLWLLLVARLLMPVVPPSAFSIFNLTGIDRANSRGDVREPAPLVGADVSFPVHNFNRTPNRNFAGEKESRRASFDPGIAPRGAVIGPNSPAQIDWLKVACCGWLAGVQFFGLRLAWVHLRFRSRIERHRPIADENVTRLFDECREEFKITQPVRIIESTEVESPGVYGLWRKWLLLPDGVFERLSHEELRHTFLHELAHIQRRDLEVNWLMSLLQILHWFNPAIWLAFARMRSDRELATDGLVLAHVSAKDRVSYGETILKVAANLARNASQPGVVGITESKAGLQERLRAIVGAGSPKHRTWPAVGIAAIVAGVGLTGAQGTDQPEVATTSKISVISHATEVSGRVVDFRGRPVNGAQVAIHRLYSRTSFTGSPLPISSELDLAGTPTPRIFNPDFGHPMANLPLASVPWSFCTTDVQGHFFLNDLDRALGLLAVQESGFAWISSNQFSANMTVKLEHWGRIEGTLWHYNEVVTNEPVQIFFAYQEGVPLWGEHCRFNTKTDDHGRFSFNFVPPGHFGVNSAGMGERVTVKSGGTAVAKLGGSGWPVIGKFKIRNPGGKIESADEFRYNFFTSMADLNVRIEEDVKKLRTHPAWENTFTNFHIRPVQCAKDGSFRIDQVEPGKYALIVETALATTPGLWLTGAREVEIPTSEPSLRKPLDLGVIEISLRSAYGSTQ